MRQQEQWLDAYSGELAHIFKEVEQSISEFPDALRRRGLHYISLFHPLLSNSTKNYICYLLPYWLQSWSGISQSDCRRLAVANVWVMLQYFSLDDAMDERPDDSKERLALAQLFSAFSLNEYRGLFNSDSAFWPAMNRYIANWAEAVVEEDNVDYFTIERSKLAWKAAPVKLAAAGAFVRGKREHLLAQAERAIDIVLVTLQMSDDWNDWQEDLATGSYNSLLSLIRSKIGAKPDQSLTKQQYLSALYDLQLHIEFAEEARQQEERLHEAQSQSLELNAFHQHLVHSMTTRSTAISNETHLLTRGGFYWWLSNKRKNE